MNSTPSSAWRGSLNLTTGASGEARFAVFATTDSATIIDRHDFDGDILELVEEAQKSSSRISMEEMRKGWATWSGTIFWPLTR